ncbi:uncharacterized protein PHACADRAFT_209654 [Phanerochaete carnosa HHB-10118-sp]|uniref:3-oxoacyl-[acyl-carrier-protein] reductase n=1 Tax=Phanerochaete carnosa (strain HHB-10118-sp) TaxID=650164 RepID=K5WAC1_PHACS|nr:uncharacterized protein PHACADRAFT_209654 [Phanerochaete carnosa HHB-10118-sp]EKM56170.1 hypothetical protein PHACADRAFT_209654 [Phanerochaete carnosa HHB-10118-sp]
MSLTASLKGKLALITGCTGGIGSATARLLAQYGCSIAVHHSSEATKAKADELVAELTKHEGVKAAAFQANLLTFEETKKLYDEVVQKLGNPDILFGNAGAPFTQIGPTGNIRDISPQEFENTWRLNVGADYYLSHLCVPHMEQQKWGRVVFTSSVGALTGGVVGPHYASSKAAIHGLVRWLSLRYAKDGICTNAIAPWLIEDTGIVRNATLPPDIASQIPVGRLGRPEEVASVVLMLVQNGFMTNKVITIDGGWTNGGL